MDKARKSVRRTKLAKPKSTPTSVSTAKPEPASAPAAKRIERIATVELPVSDLDRAVNWYQQMLGLRCTWRDDGAAMLSFGVGTGVFLVKTEDPRRIAFTCTGTGVRHSVVDFLTRNLVGFHRALRDAGADVDELGPGAHGFGFRDSDGNHLGACDVT